MAPAKSATPAHRDAGDGCREQERFGGVSSEPVAALSKRARAKLADINRGPSFSKANPITIDTPSDLDHLRDNSIGHRSPPNFAEVEQRLSGNASRPALQRDTPVVCPSCGRKINRKSRQQAYCSRRCRQRAYWDRKATAKIAAIVTPDTRHSTHHTKSANSIKDLREQKSGPSISATTPLDLVGGRWRWPNTPRLDPGKCRTILEREIGRRFVAVLNTEPNRLPGSDASSKEKPHVREREAQNQKAVAHAGYRKAPGGASAFAR